MYMALVCVKKTSNSLGFRNATHPVQITIGGMTSQNAVENRYSVL